MMRFLGIIPLLYILRKDLEEQWFRLWCQNRSSFSYLPKRALVDHILDMSYLVISATTAYFSNSSKLVGIWDGLLVGVVSSSPASSISSWPQILILRCIYRKPPWWAPLEWLIWVDLTFSGISRYLLGIDSLWNSPSWVRKVMIGNKNRVPRPVP